MNDCVWLSGITLLKMMTESWGWCYTYLEHYRAEESSIPAGWSAASQRENGMLSYVTTCQGARCAKVESVGMAIELSWIQAMELYSIVV